MSVDAGVYIRIEAEGADWPLAVLQGLFDAGWRADDHGKLVCLPIGDGDDYGWTALPEGSSIEELFKAKLELRETLGVTITWGDTQIGGTLLMAPSRTVTFSASIDRQCLPASRTSDVSWYLPKLLGGIAKSGVHVTSWQWAESE